MEGSNNKVPVADLTREQLLEKISILQTKLKEVLAKKNTLVSAITIEKLHSRQYEEQNKKLIAENEYLKSQLGRIVEPIPQIQKNNEAQEIEKSEVSSESYEFLDLNNLVIGGDQETKGHILESVSSQINKEAFLRKPDYDIKIKLLSIKDFESGFCSIKSKISEQELFQKIQNKNLILAAFGSKNVGKTYILNKICGFELPVNSLEKSPSQGLIMKYSKNTELGFIDFYGSHIFNEELNSRRDDIRIEDRILMKNFIEDFMMESCDAILIIVGEMSFEDEILIEKIKKLYYKKKKIFLIHNYSQISDIESVERRIDVDLKMESKTNKKLIHMIFAKEYSPSGQKFNKNGIESLKKSLFANHKLKSFDIIEKLKEFYHKNGYRYQFTKESFLEEKLINDKKFLLSTSTKNTEKMTFLQKFDVYGNIVDNLLSPNYSIINISSTLIKVYVEVPGVINYKVCIAKNCDNYENLILLIKLTKYELENYENEKKLEEIETQIQIPLNDILISQKSTIKGHQMENGILQIELQLS